jgi:phage terminase small subunit
MNKLPKAPSGLSNEGKRLWRAILTDWPISDAAHLAVLKVGLEALDRAARCRAIVDQEGELAKDRFGQAKPHPLLAAERDARATFFRSVQVLGLNPSEIEV